MLTTVGNRFRQPGEDSADGPTGIIGRAVTARDEEAEQTDGRPVTDGGAARRRWAPAVADLRAPGGQARAGPGHSRRPDPRRPGGAAGARRDGRAAEHAGGGS